MLDPRYDNDKEPLLELNALQLKMKRQVEQKVKDGIYKFEDVPCAVCDGSNFELLSQKDRYGLYMPVVICKDCGLIQTNPRMDQDAYNEFYDTEYRKLYVGVEKPTSDYFQGQYSRGREMFERLKTNNLLKASENMFVLEVGCGSGGILQYFKEQGCQVKGVDLGEAYIGYGINQHSLDLSVGTLDTLNLDKAPDLIIYSHVLEHVLTPNDELRKVYNSLSDEGLLYIEVPSVKNLMNKYSYGMDFLRLMQNAHTYHFTPRSLCNLLGRNNFELVFSRTGQFLHSVFKKIETEYSSMMQFLQKLELIRGH